MADNLLGITPALIKKAKDAIKAERDLLQGVLDAHEAWLKFRKANGGDALAAIREDLDARFDDPNEWRHQVRSVLFQAMWRGLDVRGYSKAMSEAGESLTGRIGAISTADEILLELERIEKTRAASSRLAQILQEEGLR